MRNAVTLRDISAFLDEGDRPGGVLLGQRVGDGGARDTAAHDCDAKGLRTPCAVLVFRHGLRRTHALCKPNIPLAFRSLEALYDDVYTAADLKRINREIENGAKENSEIQ